MKLKSPKLIFPDDLRSKNLKAYAILLNLYSIFYVNRVKHSWRDVTWGDDRFDLFKDDAEFIGLWLS